MQMPLTSFSRTNRCGITYKPPRCDGVVVAIKLDTQVGAAQRFCRNHRGAGAHEWIEYQTVRLLFQFGFVDNGVDGIRHGD